MKYNNILLTMGFITILIGGSCKKSFLDTVAQDGSVSDATAFKTNADFKAGVIGIYTSLQGGNAAGENWIKIPAFISQDMTDVAQAVKPISSYMTPNNGDFVGYWTELYKIVASANIIIEKLPKAPAGILTPAESKSYEAQAKFLRGFAYFMLARAFGDVPMPLTSYTPDLNSLACTPEAQIWAEVIKDLTFAAANLPEANDWAAADKGRATKGGALAYLANAYMYVKDWTNAGKATADLFGLTKPKYEMAPSCRTAFSIILKATSAYTKENIFEVQYRTKAGDNFQWGGTPNTGHLQAGLNGPRGIGNKYSAWGGWGEQTVNIKAVNSFEPGDDRRKHLIIKYGESHKGELFADSLKGAAWDPCKQTNSGFCAKYWLGDDGEQLSNQNLPQMRFAEVLLNNAEILFNQTNSAGAYENLNLVRQRAKLPALPVSSDAIVFMKNLMDERRHELLFEPNLWFHYTRTKTAAKFLLDNYGITMQEKWYRFPIPQRDRDVNPSLCSNGY